MPETAPKYVLCIVAFLEATLDDLPTLTYTDGGRFLWHSVELHDAFHDCVNYLLNHPKHYDTAAVIVGRYYTYVESVIL